MTKAKTKKKSSDKKQARATIPARVKILVAVLSLVLVAGVTGVKYFQSPAGRVVLLDQGFDSYYTLVRNDIGIALANELESFGLRRAIRETQAFRKMIWEI